MEIYNIYCDESCHLENDRMPIMGFGSIWCSMKEVPRLSKEISEIKQRHKAIGELKWTKVSKAREAFYADLINWFFDEPMIHFRAIIVLNKSKLRHEYFNKNSHDTFYYKMYYSLLNKILSPDNKYNVYLDIKDTKSRLMTRKLKEVLCNNVYDFTGQMIERIQNIRSHESHLLQLADLLLGALTYYHRKLTTNLTKQTIVQLIESKSNFPISSSTPLREEKLNLFIFTPQDIA